ncbi:hypothetical protein EHQ12_06090 [Leptospira gomenensis]|uniref:Uncharacterized protein n=2 Tax=Leptospira gomenensis TaxID=2484974 RepID=A0A5F1Y9F4_9LEPT|nr:hypothetical protein [Leptospira gomenensis]TGK31843.1 hypothetical protein EHQ17_13735 [Leptospira gomenensis]TGK41696.1 hypothetical protein EHQ07_15745 [Leptospira gomenensis]TGK41719.1 hypothetical protein EHQ12_06090 [Leptospira gomenensis]TGK61511.1 hypothetical protein EHQ13_09125 [Leptospira gomenensis]
MQVYNSNQNIQTVWKKVILIFPLLLLLGIFSPIVSVSQEEEERLLEKALVESAVTPGQKLAIANYLKATAIAKRSRAIELRELAKLSRGEKFLQARARKEKLERMAESLERQADRHEAVLKEFQIESH